MRRIRVLAMAFACVVWPAPATLASDVRSTRAVRGGFLVGFSVGPGTTFPCDTCASFRGEVHVGAMATEQLAVLAEVEGTGANDGYDGLYLITIGAQFWPGPPSRCRGTAWYPPPASLERRVARRTGRP
jgi:hypothetical protein